MRLQIVGWGDYEKSDTRKVKGPLSWCARCVDLLSPDILEVLAEPDHLAILGAFDLIVRYAANRGDGDRHKPIELTPRVLAVAVRTSEKDLRRAVSVLSRKQIGWVESDWEVSCDTQTATQGSQKELPNRNVVGGSSEDPPKIFGESSAHITLHNTTEENPPSVGARAEDGVAPEQAKRRLKKSNVPELAIWDEAYLAARGVPYPRSSFAKEGGLSKRLPAEWRADAPGLRMAMDAALGDQWFTEHSGDFSLFVSQFPRWAGAVVRSSLTVGGAPKSAGGALNVLARDAAAERKNGESSDGKS